MALDMTWDERKEKALDLIAFLAAFEIGKGDAENILSIAYGALTKMGEGEYKKTGAGMAAFAQMLDAKQKGEIQ